MKEFPNLSVLEIETASMCNRRCPTCLRNSHPNREAVASWFEEHYLPIDDIVEIVKQSNEMGFDYKINLSHYNEPLLDERLPEIGRRVKTVGKYTELSFHSNGDFLTKEMAEELDGVFDYIAFALYSHKDNEEERRKFISSLFQKTRLVFMNTTHMTIHFSPNESLQERIQRYINTTCIEPQVRLVFNHKGEMLFCCEDLVGNFDLGSFPDKSVKELWYGAQDKINILNIPGGRKQFPYCSICPRR